MSNVIDKKKPEKFLFNLNIFDEDFVDDSESEEEAPPTYSQEELEAARKEGYENGRRDGLKESAESREQFVASQLEVIVKHIPTLAEAESRREKTYEQEAVMLAGLAFKKLFPTLNEKHGLDEILGVIRKTLQVVEGQKQITIEVTPDVASQIKELLSSVEPLAATASIEVKPCPDISAGSCRMVWNDGGAVRDAAAITAEIEKQIEQLLAPRGASITALENAIEEESEPAGSTDPGPDSNDGEDNE